MTKHPAAVRRDNGFLLEERELLLDQLAVEGTTLLRNIHQAAARCQSPASHLLLAPSLLHLLQAVRIPPTAHALLQVTKQSSSIPTASPRQSSSERSPMRRPHASNLPLREPYLPGDTGQQSVSQHPGRCLQTCARSRPSGNLLQSHPSR